MAIEEVPGGDPNKTFARKVAAWVESYPKPVLDWFLDQIRALRDEMQQIYTDFLAAQQTFLTDVPDNKKYSRTKGGWVEATGGGGEVVQVVTPVLLGEEGQQIYGVDIAAYPNATHFWILPPVEVVEGYEYITCVLMLPFVQGDKALTFTVSPSWRVDPTWFNNLYDSVMILAPADGVNQIYQNFRPIDGNSTCNQLYFLLRGTYRAMAINGQWEVSEAVI